MPALANTDDQEEEKALAEFARELAKQTGVSNSVEEIVSRIRWYPNSANAVVIVSKGKDRKVLATISPKSGKWTHLYPSWEPVLARRAEKALANGVSRVSHNDLPMGDVPK